MTREYDCNAWQSDASIVPAKYKKKYTKLESNNPNDDRSYFYIRVVVDFGTFLIEDEEKDTRHGLPIRTLKAAEKVKGFEIPADDLVEDKNTCGSTISTMLSAMKVPEEAHPDMVHTIAHCARDMAKDKAAFANNGGSKSKVLPMIVKIYVEDYIVDYDDEDFVRN